MLGGLLLAPLITVLFAIPSLIGAQAFAINGTARDNLDTVFPAVKVLYGINNGSFGPVTAAQLVAAEPTLAFAAGTAAPATSTATGKSLILAAQSSTGNCYWLLEIENSTSHAMSRFTIAPRRSGGVVTVGAVYMESGTFYADAVQGGGSTCSAASPPAGGWSPTRFPSIS